MSIPVITSGTGLILFFFVIFSSIHNWFFAICVLMERDNCYQVDELIGGTNSYMWIIMGEREKLKQTTAFYIFIFCFYICLCHLLSTLTCILFLFFLHFCIIFITISFFRSTSSSSQWIFSFFLDCSNQNITSSLKFRSRTSTEKPIKLEFLTFLDFLTNIFPFSISHLFVIVNTIHILETYNITRSDHFQSYILFPPKKDLQIHKTLQKEESKS